MENLKCLVIRNCKLFFKDKGLFLTSLITPLILLVLYVTFLANVYEESFAQGFGDTVIPERLMSGLVGGQLLSSLLAVCCVTTAFCSNMLMVQDKVSGARDDIAMTPVSSGIVAASYYISTAISTMLVCFFACGVGFIYLAVIGWYLSVTDVLLLMLDIFIVVMFGTALSSAVNHFLTSQGQISAVGSIVSSMYGFICGAYMPISQFGEGLRNFIGFLPGTYGTALMRKHAMNGAFKELVKNGVSEEEVKILRDVVDSNIYVFDKPVSTEIMYLIISFSVLIFAGIYVIINLHKNKPNK